MRKLLCSGVAIVLALATFASARADDAADARALIDKGIKALGGKDKLAKVQAQTWKEKGTYYGMGKGIPYTSVCAVQWPDKFRMEVEGVFTIVPNGDKGWIKSEGETKEMSKEQLAAQKESHHAGWVTTLLPLDDKSYSLALLPESKVDGKPAAGIKVTKKGMPDVSLFFDKESGLPVKSTFRTKAEEQGNKEVIQDVYYGGYRDVNGVKIPGKITIKRDDKPFVEAENSDIKLAEKLDEKTFAKP